MKETYGVAYNDYYNGQLDDIMSRLSQGIAEVDPTINDMPYLICTLCALTPILTPSVPMAMSCVLISACFT